MRPLTVAIGVVVALAVVAGVGFWLLTAPRTIAADALPAHRPDLENGRFVFFAGGCGACHAAPDAEGDERFLLGGGAPMETPFGTFYAPNISPDPQDGIGAWSKIDFVNAVLRGVAPDGRHLYPAFPYTSYQYMTVEDALDLAAFIDTLPPVAGKAPEHELPLLFRFRRGIGLWKRLYMARDPYLFGADADAQVRRGAYLVVALGHCSQCHTPRGVFGGLLSDRFMAGGPSPTDPSKRIPNITPSPDGIGAWSTKDIVDALRTGFLPGFETFGGEMAEVQQNMAELPAEDLEAIAAYLQAIPPLPNAPDG